MNEGNAVVRRFAIIGKTAGRRDGGPTAVFPLLVSLFLALAAILGGCTGTVVVEPTDLSPVELGADREAVEEAVGTPDKIYESRGLTYATYRYNSGGRRNYDIGPKNADELIQSIVMLPLLPIAVPVGHAVARPMEKAALWVEQRERLCVIYGEDGRVVEMTRRAPAPCEPPGGIWGEKQVGLRDEARKTPTVDPERKARIDAYLEANMKRFERAMRDYEVKNPGSLSERPERAGSVIVFSYDVLQASEERTVLKALFESGGQPRTMQFLVRWHDGDLQVLAHRDHPPDENESSS